MNHRGVGDRWLAGEHVEGVTFAHNQKVEILTGRYEGDAGTVVLLTALEPEPRYLIQLASGKGDVQVLQSALRA